MNIIYHQLEVAMDQLPMLTTTFTAQKYVQDLT